MLAVGLGIGLSLLLALLGTLFLLRKEKKKARELTAVQAAYNMRAMELPNKQLVQQVGGGMENHFSYEKAESGGTSKCSEG